MILKIREYVYLAKYSNFWSNYDFNVLMDMQSATPTKVVNCLITYHVVTNDEGFFIFLLCISIALTKESYAS